MRGECEARSVGKIAVYTILKRLLKKPCSHCLAPLNLRYDE
jgi:hypothetical protein